MGIFSPEIRGAESATKKVRGLLRNVARRVIPDIETVKKVASFPVADFQFPDLPTAQVSTTPDSEIERRNRLTNAIRTEVIHMVDEVTRVATEQIIANRPEPELTKTTVTPQAIEAPEAVDPPTPIKEDIDFIRGIGVIRDMDELFKRNHMPRIGEDGSRDEKLAQSFDAEIYPLVKKSSIVTPRGLREGYVALAELYRSDPPTWDKHIAEEFPGIL